MISRQAIKTVATKYKILLPVASFITKPTHTFQSAIITGPPISGETSTGK